MKQPNQIRGYISIFGNNLHRRRPERTRLADLKVFLTEPHLQIYVPFGINIYQHISHILAVMDVPVIPLSDWLL